jgi:branched-chain amino acid transport system substrate-binding protein
MMYPGISQMISEYQSRAAAEGADPLGYYVAPQAYAQMQIVEQAVTATGSLDDAKLAQFTRDHSFKTILGELKFGAGGGWSEARVLQVQYRNIKGNDLSNFRHAETQAVVWPPSLASAALIYPYANARQNS